MQLLHHPGTIPGNGLLLDPTSPRTAGSESCTSGMVRHLHPGGCQRLRGGGPVPRHIVRRTESAPGDARGLTLSRPDPRRYPTVGALDCDSPEDAGRSQPFQAITSLCEDDESSFRPEAQRAREATGCRPPPSSPQLSLFPESTETGTKNEVIRPHESSHRGFRTADGFAMGQARLAAVP